MGDQSNIRVQNPYDNDRKHIWLKVRCYKRQKEDIVGSNR